MRLIFSFFSRFLSRALPKLARAPLGRTLALGGRQFAPFGVAATERLAARSATGASSSLLRTLTARIGSAARTPLGKGVGTFLSYLGFDLVWKQISSRPIPGGYPAFEDLVKTTNAQLYSNRASLPVDARQVFVNLGWTDLCTSGDDGEIDPVPVVADPDPKKQEGDGSRIYRSASPYSMNSGNNIFKTARLFRELAAKYASVLASLESAVCQDEEYLQGGGVLSYDTIMARRRSIDEFIALSSELYGVMLLGQFFVTSKTALPVTAIVNGTRVAAEGCAQSHRKLIDRRALDSVLRRLQEDSSLTSSILMQSLRVLSDNVSLLRQAAYKNLPY